MPVENPGYDDGTLTVTGVSVSDRVGSGFIVHTNRPPTLQEIEDFANSLATQPDHYREGFERAREMAAEQAEMWGDGVIARSIRAMEVPGDE